MLNAAQMRFVFLLLSIAAPAAFGGPHVPAGDLALRFDIQRLADAGVIAGTTTTWPMAWGPILDDIRDADITSLRPAVADALVRIRDRANWETRTHQWIFKGKVAGAENPSRLRSFQDSPRGEIDVSVGAGWLGDRISIELNVQGVDSERDDDAVRVDDSLLGFVVGNWSISASTQQRWWGPGWDGSIILSNNARPIPSVAIDRVYTDAFKTRWLSWMGPWDLSVMYGQLESDRVVPNAHFFAMRYNFRPLSSVEIGLSRTAQWCGDGRPCGLDTFVDLLLGKDNIGDDSVGAENEPGNQMAGFDARWSPRFLEQSVALYAQLIGEDEAGGFPSRYLGTLGAEWSTYLFDRWATKLYAEFSGTACQFYESSKRYNCGYNQLIYRTGYRYRGRAIGHGADNDAELTSIGAILVDAEDTQWRGLLRVGKLNAGGPADPTHSVTPTPQDLLSLDISHSRVFTFGVIDLGAGYERIDDDASGQSFSDTRFYVQWRSAY